MFVAVVTDTTSVLLEDVEFPQSMNHSGGEAIMYLHTTLVHVAHKTYIRDTERQTLLLRIYCTLHRTGHSTFLW